MVRSYLSLRVPLSNIQSTTYAEYPGETHSEIRRAYTPRHAPHTKRHFCGFCGTPLTHWTEEKKGEADWILVNLGSLSSQSIEKLSDEGLLYGDDDGQSPNAAAAAAAAAREHPSDLSIMSNERKIRGAPWFEQMVEGSHLGRIKRRIGGQTSADGKSKVEWEVVEFTTEPGNGERGTGKRKLDQVGKEGDVEMEG
ncbi:MAG: hypothetical protein Q9184_002831 [Pyrenodesmia sp. 2 TL-2023]